MNINFKKSIFLFSFCSIHNLLGADKNYACYDQRSVEEKDLDDHSLYELPTELTMQIQEYLGCNEVFPLYALEGTRVVEIYQREPEDLHVPKTLPENYLAHAKPEQLRSIIFAALKLELAPVLRIIAKKS